LSSSWDESGVLTRLTVDDPDGTSKRVDYSDGLRAKEVVSKNGVLLRRRMWHATGARAFDYSCRNGKPHGLYTSWHPNGKVRKKGTYENGDRVGTFQGFDAEGKLQRIWHYQNGDILKIDLYENEKVVAIEHWKDGKAVSTERVDNPTN
jgi:antitoxin component YwqK of YwqJK toxin-antitoxin module